MLNEYIIAIVGSGAVGAVIMYLFNKGRQAQVIADHCDDIENLKQEHELLKGRVVTLEQNTSVRLATIETELKNVSAKLIELSMDVKQILKKYAWEEN